LVQAMGEENEPVLTAVAKDAIVVRVKGVSVPMPRQQLQREQATEAFQVEHGFETRPAFCGIRLSRRRQKLLDGDAVLIRAAVGDNRRLVDVAEEAPFVERSPGIREMALDELAIPAFEQDVEPEPPPVQ